MIPLNPNHVNINSFPGVLKQSQSTFKALNGALSLAQPTGQDSTGVYNKFTIDNFDGVMVRIGSSSSSEPIKFVTANTGVNINHGLQRQPTGFIVCDKDKASDIYRTAVPTSSIISIAAVDPTVNCTVFIF